MPLQMRITTGISLQDAKIAENGDGYAGNRYPNSPRFQASAFAGYNRAQWGWSALTTRLGVIRLVEREGNSANTFQLPAHTRVDTGASCGIDANLSLNLTIQNLFDKTHYPAAQDGGSGARQISVGDPRPASGAALQIMRLYCC